jgi:exodeoxyribonuclease V alpha subunit
MTAIPLPFPPTEPPPPTNDAGDGREREDEVDGHRRDGRRVLDPPPTLVPFVDAGVLSAADVHVAVTLTRVLSEQDPVVLLGAALAVRAPRLQHVCLDLRQVRGTIVTDLADVDLSGSAPAGGEAATPDLEALPWPDPDEWAARLAASPLVAVRDPGERLLDGSPAAAVAPLTLAGDRLYLDRYWRYERLVAAALDARAQRPVAEVDHERLRAALDTTFDGPAPDGQRLAAATAVLRHLAIVAGGPGTGKTTTVAAILRLLDDQATALGRRPPTVALAAPTGKAAQRLTASLREGADRPGTASAGARDRLREATATTIHRLLGVRHGSNRFRHHRDDPLPHDVVVVDETSMVDLALLAKLLDAIRDDARLILLGDPHQLASVEAGSALGDVLGEPGTPPARSPDVLADLLRVVGTDHLPRGEEAAGHGVHDVTVVLDRVHRFRAGSGLDRLAAAIRNGDADTALHELEMADELTWIAIAEGDAGDRSWASRQRHLEGRLEPLRPGIVAAATEVHTAAAAGDGAAALAALDRTRVLCAHRRGALGVAGWTARIEHWLAATGRLDPSLRWYVGRPVLVTRNDHRQQLYNGDLGVVVRDRDGQLTVAFPAPDGLGIRHLRPTRLGEVETVHAMTVHKSQGSQVDRATVVLPHPASRICTRELLYTAVTRAKEGAAVVASEAALRDTIATRIARTSGLADALAIR